MVFDMSRGIMHLMLEYLLAMSASSLVIVFAQKYLSSLQNLELSTLSLPRSIIITGNEQNIKHPLSDRPSLALQNASPCTLDT